MREVDLVSYLPDFMKDYKELSAALEAENPEFDLIWSAVDKVFYNHFISTADEYGISRFEKLLGIFPNVTDSLEIRRKRVQSAWFNKLPYNLKVLTEKIRKLLGETCDFEVKTDFVNAYHLQIVVYTLDDSQRQDLEQLLAVMVPLNMVIRVTYEGVSKGGIYYGGILRNAEIITIKQRKV